MARTKTPPSLIGQLPGTALHRQLFVVLRDEITSGVYAGTGALPQERALCDRFGVSRITVRRALADLAALGLVERRHGLGTFVHPAVAAPRSNPSLSVIDSLQQGAIETDVRVLKIERAAPPPEVAAMLQLAPDLAAVHAIRLRSIRGTPVMLTDAWVPPDIGHKVTVAALRKQALYELLIEQGIQFGRVVQEMGTQLADPARAGLLKTEIGSPLIKLIRLMHDRDARPVQYLTLLMSSERSRVLMEFPGKLVNTLSAGKIIHDVPPSRGNQKTKAQT